MTLPELTRPELLRYARHLALPGVGVEGQRRLKAARVLCVGAGGLGSPLALYLAAAGVGTLGIVDFDVLDGLEEPVFDSDGIDDQRPLSWYSYPQIPPVLAGRFRVR